MDWKEENGVLKSKTRFSSQSEMATFLVSIAKIADEMDHHPDITVKKAFELTLELVTHSQGKITDKDHVLAKKISDAYRSFCENSVVNIL